MKAAIVYAWYTTNSLCMNDIVELILKCKIIINLIGQYDIALAGFTSYCVEWLGHQDYI